jgi:hypothetical protein
MFNKFISTTLVGGEVFADYDLALASFDAHSAEYKGVFRMGYNHKGSPELFPVNFVGKLFNEKYNQLKLISGAVLMGVPLPEKDKVFVSLFMNEEKLACVASVSTDTELSDEAASVFPRVNKDDCLSWYYPVIILSWRDGDTPFGEGLVAETQEANLFIVKNQLVSTVGSSTHIIMSSPHDYVLRNKAREYLEILRECRSVGWSKENVLPLPASNEVKFRKYSGSPWGREVARLSIFKNKPSYD